MLDGLLKREHTGDLRAGQERVSLWPFRTCGRIWRL